MFETKDIDLSIREMKLLDLFDDVPYKYIKYNNYDSDNCDSDEIGVTIEDLPYDMDWCKTRFTFNLYGYTFPSGDDEYKEFVVEKVYRHYSTYHNTLSDILSFYEEEEEEEDTLTMKKIFAIMSRMVYEKTPYASSIKEKIIVSEELAKQVKIISRLSQKAINDKDIELWKKMDKKRKEIVYKIMDNLEDIKNDITENEYLKLCNYIKSIF